MKRKFRQIIDDAVDEKVLDVDASMQGTLSFNDPVNLRINGRFEGKLSTKGTLTIGENADVRAEISGETIIIAGRVNGNIKASKEIKIISPAVIHGNIETPVFAVQEGALIDGNIKMSEADASAEAAALMSVDEVASYLEIDKSLVMEWADNGRLPGVKEQDGWKFDRMTIDRWISNEKIN